MMEKEQSVVGGVRGGYRETDLDIERGAERQREEESEAARSLSAACDRCSRSLFY